MSKCRLRIQPAKCEFFRESGSFLGHVLSAEGVAQQDGKVQAIKKQQVFDVPAPPKPVKSDANRAAAASGDASVAASGVDSRLRRAPNVTIPSGNLRRSARLRATT
jgi:hypothetical protein